MDELSESGVPGFPVEVPEDPFMKAALVLLYREVARTSRVVLTKADYDEFAAVMSGKPFAMVESTNQRGDVIFTLVKSRSDA